MKKEELKIGEKYQIPGVQGTVIFEGYEMGTDDKNRFGRHAVFSLGLLGIVSRHESDLDGVVSAEPKK